MKSKLTTFLLAALFAFGLWLFVVTVEQPESEQTYYEIPVIYQNNGEELLKDRSLMIVSERPTVTLKLKSTRSNLRNLNESNINILVSLSNVTGPGTHSLNYTISYPGNVPASEVSVVSTSMEQVSIKVENRITNSAVPVEVVTSGQVADPQNTIPLTSPEDIEVEYPTIEVVGPESVMPEGMKAVVNVDLTGQSQTIAGEYPFTLCDKDGNPILDTSNMTINPDISAVNVTVKIYKLKELPLKVKVVPGAGATEATSSIKLEPSTIQVYGPESLLANLEYLEIGVVDLGTVTKDETKVLPITLPEGVTNNTDITEVAVDIKFPQLITRKMTVETVEFLNLPEGLEAKLNSASLNVTLRGLAGQMGSLKVSDLTVTVDMTDAQPGTSIKSVTVTINSKYPDVGIVSISDVYVTVTEAETEKK